VALAIKLGQLGPLLINDQWEGFFISEEDPQTGEIKQRPNLQDFMHFSL
jgi:hypothetical protein